VNAPITPPATNLRDGEMTYQVDRSGNPHVNYEPSSTGGLAESPKPGPAYEPLITGKLTRARLEREANYLQAGERYRTMPSWERDDLVLNLITLLGQCEKHIQERMTAHFTKCDPEFR